MKNRDLNNERTKKAPNGIGQNTKFINMERGDKNENTSHISERKRS